MAGCYGNSPEDKALEARLYAYLDEQDAHMDALEALIAGLLEQANTDEGASKLVDDYEVFLTKLPQIIKLIAEAKLQAAAWQPERRSRMAALGEDLALMLGDELERIAVHQMGE